MRCNIIPTTPRTSKIRLLVIAILFNKFIGGVYLAQFMSSRILNKVENVIEDRVSVSGCPKFGWSKLICFSLQIRE